MANVRTVRCNLLQVEVKSWGKDASDPKQVKERESALPQYKRMYAELTRQNDMIKDLIAKML